MAETFDMQIRYSLTFVPIDTRFIVLEDGKLIYVKKSKLSLELVPGDRIVYNVYALSPNEVLAVKNLTDYLLKFPYRPVRELFVGKPGKRLLLGVLALSCLMMTVKKSEQRL